MELIKDYDILILYHPCKAKVVANALRQKLVNILSLALLEIWRYLLVGEVLSLANNFPWLYEMRKGGVLAYIEVRYTFYDQNKDRKFGYTKLSNVKEKVLQGEAREAILNDEVALKIWKLLYEPYVGNCIPIILEEDYNSMYSIHPGSNKMYRYLRKHN